MLTPANPTPITENNSDNNDDLSSEEIKKLTSQLSQEIDQEIRKQFAQNQIVDQTQEKVNEILKKEQETKQNLPPEEPSANPKLENLGSSLPSQTENEEIHFDPLRSSVDSALLNLKEGDNVSKDWVLKKILTTSFGNNKSSFYELQNTAGALWTLSPEEMREVLKTEIIAKNTSPNPPPNLGPENAKVTVKHDEKQVVAPVEEEVEIVDQSSEKETATESEKVIFEPEKTKGESKDLDLTKKQIELVNKIHTDKNLWEIFTSFTPELWNKVYQLYETGKLTAIGIEAHPLLDQLENADFGDMVEIEKGTTAAKLFTENGYNLSWSENDALILGCHILANYNILKETIKKVEANAIAVSTLQTKQELIKLISQASVGNKTALQTLQEDLRFLPVNGKFKIIKPSQLEPLKKYI